MSRPQSTSTKDVWYFKELSPLAVTHYSEWAIISLVEPMSTNSSKLTTKFKFDKKTEIRSLMGILWRKVRDACKCRGD